MSTQTENAKTEVHDTEAPQLGKQAAKPRPVKTAPEQPAAPSHDAAPPTAEPAEAEAPKKSGSRGFLILGAMVAVFAIAIVGYTILTGDEEDTDDALVWADMVPISTRVGGQVIKVEVQENQVVKKGDVLAEIDDADYAAKLQQAEAELLTAKAQATAADAQAEVVEATSKGGLVSARASMSGSTVGVSSADAQVASAKAALVRAEADTRKSNLDLKRAQELRAANAIPQQRLDDAVAGNESAQATLAQAKAQLSAAEEARHAAQARVGEAEGRLAQSSPIKSQIANAQANAALAHARVKSAEAMLELARLQLSYTKIIAPVDGLASKLAVHEGQLASLGQPVVQLVPHATYLLANFKETQVGRMKPGQSAEITIDAFPHQKFHGRVESLSGGTGSSFSMLPADNASGNFVKVVQRVPVRIAWVDPPTDLNFRAGLSADVTVTVK